MILKSLFLILFVFVHLDVFAQVRVNSSGSSKLVSQVKKDLKSYDYEAGYFNGKDFLERFPDNSELRMWTILNGAQMPQALPMALEMARAMVEKSGETKFSLIALATAESFAGNFETAIAAANKLKKLSPNDEEAIFCESSVLSKAGKHPEALDLLDKKADTIKDRSRYYSSRASVLSKIPNKKDEMIENYRRSVEIGPKSVNSLVSYAKYLKVIKKNDEALNLLRKAVEIAPESPILRFYLWDATNSQTGKEDNQIEKELDENIGVWLKEHRSNPAVMFYAALQYSQMNRPDEQTKLHEELLRRFPESRYVENITFAKLQRKQAENKRGIPAPEMARLSSELEEARLLGDKELFLEAFNQMNGGPKSIGEIKEILRTFLKRPKHYVPANFTLASSLLLQFERGNFDLTDQELAALIGNLQKYDSGMADQFVTITGADIAGFLVERKAFGLNSKVANEALKYALASFEQTEKKIGAVKLRYDEKTAESTSRLLRSNAYRLIGQAYYREHRFDEAAKPLEQALENASGVASQENRILLDLALIAREKKDFRRAEEYYLRAATFARPLKPSFRALYFAEKGNSSDFDEYYANILERVRENVKKGIIASRLKEPKVLSSFELTTIDGKKISSSDLKGKVAVINLWGLWCPPCLKELPELQKLHRKYSNESDVVILAFNSKDSIDSLKKYADEQKIGFPIIPAEAFIDKESTTTPFTFPTTLFVSKNGHVSFIEKGDSGNLVEEFSVRIEALKQDK